MPTLSEEDIAALLQAYLSPSFLQSPVTAEDQFHLRLPPTPELLPRLSKYLDLLLQWNAKTNLTAIRDPAEIVRRHFGESLFAGLCLRTVLRTGVHLLDFGSGAGFPGVPIQLLLPEVRVTLAESQSKKAGFLREVARVLQLPTTVVWSRRVGEMPSSELFDVVTMRAVDNPELAYAEGLERLRIGGYLMELRGGVSQEGALTWPIPGLSSGYVRIIRKHA